MLSIINLLYKILVTYLIPLNFYNSLLNILSKNTLLHLNFATIYRIPKYYTININTHKLHHCIHIYKCMSYINYYSLSNIQQ